MLAMGLRLTLAQARAEGREAQALMGVLRRLRVEGLGGRVVVGDTGYLYPEVARGTREKGGILVGSVGEPRGDAGLDTGDVCEVAEVSGLLVAWAGNSAEKGCPEEVLLLSPGGLGVRGTGYGITVESGNEVRGLDI